MDAFVYDLVCFLILFILSLVRSFFVVVVVWTHSFTICLFVDFERNTVELQKSSRVKAPYHWAPCWFLQVIKCN